MIKRILLTMMSVVLLVGNVSAADWKFWEKKDDKCQILDKVPPLYEASTEFITGANLESGSDLSMLGFGIMGAGPLYKDVIGADLDIRYYLENTTFITDDDVGDVSRLAVGTDFAWRLEDGYGIVVGLTPSIMGEIGEFSPDMFYLPFSMALVRSFDEEISAIFGVEVRPGFEFPVMPMLGVEWQISENARLEARIPDSRLLLTIVPDWDMYLGLKWKNLSYSVKEQDGFDREQITINDFKFLVGTMVRVADEFSILAEVGEVFGRQISYTHVVTGDKRFDVDPAPFVRVGIMGYF